MHWILLFVTFISVNLDFFFLLLFLLRKYNTTGVLIGYLIGMIFLLTLSYIIGSVLKVLLPIWMLGTLGIIPIVMAFQSEKESKHKSNSAILSTFLTYLSSCTGCNLSLFLPVLISENMNQFVLTILYISILTIIAVVLIKLIIKCKIIKQIMDKYGDFLTKVCYISVGTYIFFDSGLIHHLINLI